MKFARMKLKTSRLVALALALACALALAGCSTASEQTDEQTLNRQYMSSVSTIMSTLNDNMEDFAEAVKSGEVVTLDSQLSAVNQCISSLEALEVPDAMKDIHESYVTGAEELQTALADYVQLYEDVKAPADGEFDYSTYDQRLADIQSHYDAGIEALKEADDKAEEA